MTDTMKIGRYTVEFDDQGATIAAWDARAHYRIEAETSSNAIEFMKHHRALCFAMMNGHPEELAAFRIAGKQGN